MNIVKGKNKIVKFEELALGDVFMIHNEIYLKIGTTYSTDNSYNLRLNTLSISIADDEVIKLQAELSVW